MVEYVKVGRVEDFVEGAGRSVEVAGRWLAIFRANGAFYAIDNACPHMAGPLGAGRLDGRVVTCPLHGWRIDVATGRSPTNEHVRVARFDVRVDDGWVSVGFRSSDGES